MEIDVLELQSRFRYELMSAGARHGNEWKCHWESMTVDELFALRNRCRSFVSKLNDKKAAIERRLQPLNQLSNDIEATWPAGLDPPSQTRSSLSAGGAMTVRSSVL